MASKKKKGKRMRTLCPECRQPLTRFKGFLNEWGKFNGFLCKNPVCIVFMNIRKVSRFITEDDKIGTISFDISL